MTDCCHVQFPCISEGRSGWLGEMQVAITQSDRTAIVAWEKPNNRQPVSCEWNSPSSTRSGTTLPSSGASRRTRGSPVDSGIILHSSASSGCLLITISFRRRPRRKACCDKAWTPSHPQNADHLTTTLWDRFLPRFASLPLKRKQQCP